MMQCVVFIQSMDKDARVERIIGPFESFNAASNWIQLARQTKLEWFGIRELVNPETETQSWLISK